eukprot:TRINITY_DN7427_c0_g1_i2.p3 TRINITY_DN7427_c0_g1~~TRINITY_DN7427_c0_g1_i2.p3  ORF type:complete len:233 (+),score=28.84 TRINITY_DN7427_c0_g1_i2:1274-1972(+)
MEFKWKIVSSLEKVFADEELNCSCFESVSVLRGEVFSFQLAYYCDKRADLSVKIDSSCKNLIQIRETALAPCEIPADDIADTSDVLRAVPGLYPDPLMPMKEKMVVLPEQWRTLWVTVSIADDETAGEKIISCHANVSVADTEDRIDAETSIKLNVLPYSLQKQTLIHTEWFHSDCIYSYSYRAWINQQYMHPVNPNDYDSSTLHYKMSKYSLNGTIPYESMFVFAKNTATH